MRGFLAALGMTAREKRKYSYTQALIHSRAYTLIRSYTHILTRLYTHNMRKVGSRDRDAGAGLIGFLAVAQEEGGAVIGERGLGAVGIERGEEAVEGELGGERGF